MNNFVKEYGRITFLKKHKRYTKGILIIVLSLITSYLLLFLKDGMSSSFVNKIYQRGDAYVFSLSKTESIIDDGVSIVKTYCPSINEGMALKKYCNSLKVGYNLSYFFPNTISFNIDGKVCNARFVPFDYIDKTLLKNDTVVPNNLDGVLVNKAFIDKYKDIKNIEINIKKDIVNVINNEYIEDQYLFNHTFKILNIIEEYEFNAVPTIYYHYESSLLCIQNSYLKNYSLYCGRVVTWFDYLVNTSSLSHVKGFSLLLFLKSKSDVQTLINIFENLTNKSFILESEIINIKVVLESFVFLIDSLFKIIIFFLSIVLISVVIYLTIIHLLQDRHELTILFALGTSKLQIIKSYIHISFIYIVKSIIYGLAISILLSFFGNIIINNKFGKVNFFNINRWFIYTLFFFFTLNIVCSLITYLITKYSFKKEIDCLLKEE